MNIEKFIGFHRGISKKGVPNSYDAIKDAIKKNPIFIEFDVFEKNGEIYTGHPPNEPVSNFKDVIKLFKNKKTFPKIDIKINKEYENLIKNVIKSLKDIKFVLINIGGVKGKEAMKIEEFLFKNASPNVMINIDLARYLNEPFEEHIIKISKKIFSISPEINETNWKQVFQFAKQHNIFVCNFWLRSWPDVPNPHIKKEKLEKAFYLGRKHNLIILFDLSKKFIIK